MSKKALGIIIVLVIAIIGAGAAYAILSKDKAAPERSAPASEPVAKNMNPLTGLEMPDDAMIRPFVVSTDNDSYRSRPQAGLSQADILYEVPIEGGGSRYEPIYYSQKPDLIGAVRSCRPYIINIAREYKAVLVHNGKSPQAKAIFDTIDRVSAADDFEIFHQEDNPNLPGNLYTYGENVVERIAKREMDKKQDVRTFPWLAEDEEAAGEEAAEIIINYADGAYNTFKYDADSKLYTKYVKDEVLIDANNGEAVKCANILVQEVPFKMYDSQSQRLDIDPTAGGKATMFTQGKVVKGTWERKDLDSPTIFKDEEGNEFKMTPGVTWIQMIDDTVKFEY